MTRRALARTIAIVAFAGAALAPAVSAATPTIWGRARDPQGERRAALVADAESFMLKYEMVVIRATDRQNVAVGTMYLREALRLFEQADAAHASDPFVRLRYANVLADLGEFSAESFSERAVRVLQSLTQLDTPAHVRGRAWNRLGILYARLGRGDDEIRAYGEALKIEPSPFARATLLGNRAEAYMLQGDLTKAIEGYRAALAAIPTVDLRFYATTFWGLAVATDRSGDLDQALATIGMARLYDPEDKGIRDTVRWFFVPPYDDAWYAALGHWSTARNAQVRASKAEAYAAAIAAWEAYLARAPASDRWLPIARTRLRMCEKERDAALAQHKRASGDGRADDGARGRPPPN